MTTMEVTKRYTSIRHYQRLHRCPAVVMITLMQLPEELQKGLDIRCYQYGQHYPLINCILTLM
jgi:hypothetical protein